MKTALLITNLNARTVSQRVQKVIVKALSADLDLEVVDTQHRNHATEIARDAAQRGLDLVISFGGDGTMNEVVNGLVGSDTALALLPGGLANVLCRTLDIPVDIVEATGYLLNRVRSGNTRSLHLGRMDERYFVLSCGVGMDAATVRRTEERPALKRKYRDWFFVYSAFASFLKEYRGKDPYITLTAGDQSEDVLLAIVSNVPYLTYFKKWPVSVTPRADLHKGLDVYALKKFPSTYIPKLAWSLFRLKEQQGKHARYFHDVPSITLSAIEPFPIQVDGEYIGDRTDLKVDLISDGISILN
ncbi:MAG: diacylglycerol kinase family protein [Actinomycetota bacterium]|nr:diacylglycerol kinase family lipid kinase [Actinomycetota bacterium]